MEADLRKCGEDIKRGLRQSVDRTHQSPREQIQCGGGGRVDKSTTQKPCSPSPHRRPWYSSASCGAASRFCCVRRACSSGRHGGEACGGRFRPPSKTRSCGCSVNTLGGNDNRGHARVCGSGVGWLRGARTGIGRRASLISAADGHADIKNTRNEEPLTAECDLSETFYAIGGGLFRAPATCILTVANISSAAP